MKPIKGPKVKVPVARVRRANETMREMAEDHRALRAYVTHLHAEVDQRERATRATYHGDLAAVFCVGFGLAGLAAVLVGVLL